jgi:F0F1-type ATP synthase assembly protein I
VGHLAGILVGLLYTAGPLKIIMRTIAGLCVSWAMFSSLKHAQQAKKPVQ